MANFKLFWILFFACFFQIIYSQQNPSILNGNSISATLNDEGRLFHDFLQSSWGYKLTGESGHLIYSGGLWFGGTNQSGDLKLASQLYGTHREFYRGPFSTTGQYLDTSYSYTYDSGIWTIKKSEITYHIANYNQPGYIVPEAILNWPGNGNPSIGVATQLAPFVDINNNGVYEPYEGDYPCIKGDEASYQIIHEDRAHTNTGGDKVGAEVHMMLYHITSNNFIDSTTFVDVKVFNRGQNSFNDFKIAFYIDPDVGFSEDDYFGSAPSKNLMYAYNGNNNDPGMSGSPGYGNNPPAVGIMSLNKTIKHSGTFHMNGFAPSYMSEPASAEDYWSYMNGKWIDGTDWTYGGNGHGGTNGSTQHFFDGNPYLGTGWTELDIDGVGTTNQEGQRRILMTTEDEVFQPGDVLTYSYAVIVNRQGNNLENVQGVIDYADSVQQYFDNTIFSCTYTGTGTADVFEEI